MTLFNYIRKFLAVGFASTTKHFKRFFLVKKKYIFLIILGPVNLVLRLFYRLWVLPTAWAGLIRTHRALRRALDVFHLARPRSGAGASTPGVYLEAENYRSLLPHDDLADLADRLGASDILMVQNKRNRRGSLDLGVADFSIAYNQRSFSKQLPPLARFFNLNLARQAQSLWAGADVMSAVSVFYVAPEQRPAIGTDAPAGASLVIYGRYLQTTLNFSDFGSPLDYYLGLCPLPPLSPKNLHLEFLDLSSTGVAPAEISSLFYGLAADLRGARAHQRYHAARQMVLQGEGVASMATSMVQRDFDFAARGSFFEQHRIALQGRDLLRQFYPIPLGRTLSLLDLDPTFFRLLTASWKVGGTVCQLFGGSSLIPLDCWGRPVYFSQSRLGQQRWARRADFYASQALARWRQLGYDEMLYSYAQTTGGLGGYSLDHNRFFKQWQDYFPGYASYGSNALDGRFFYEFFARGASSEKVFSSLVDRAKLHLLRDRRRQLVVSLFSEPEPELALNRFFLQLAADLGVSYRQPTSNVVAARQYPLRTLHGDFLESRDHFVLSLLAGLREYVGNKYVRGRLDVFLHYDPLALFSMDPVRQAEERDFLPQAFWAFHERYVRGFLLPSSWPYLAFLNHRRADDSQEMADYFTAQKYLAPDHLASNAFRNYGRLASPSLADNVRFNDIGFSDQSLGQFDFLYTQGWRAGQRLRVYVFRPLALFFGLVHFIGLGLYLLGITFSWFYHRTVFLFRVQVVRVYRFSIRSLVALLHRLIQLRFFFLRRGIAVYPVVGLLVAMGLIFIALLRFLAPGVAVLSFHGFVWLLAGWLTAVGFFTAWQFLRSVTGSRIIAGVVSGGNAPEGAETAEWFAPWWAFFWVLSTFFIFGSGSYLFSGDHGNMGSWVHRNFRAYGVLGGLMTGPFKPAAGFDDLTLIGRRYEFTVPAGEEGSDFSVPPAEQSVFFNFQRSIFVAENLRLVPQVSFSHQKLFVHPVWLDPLYTVFQSTPVTEDLESWWRPSSPVTRLGAVDRLLALHRFRPVPEELLHGLFSLDYRARTVAPRLLAQNNPSAGGAVRLPESPSSLTFLHSGLGVPATPLGWATAVPGAGEIVRNPLLQDYASWSLGQRQRRQIKEYYIALQGAPTGVDADYSGHLAIWLPTPQLQRSGSSFLHERTLSRHRLPERWSYAVGAQYWFGSTPLYGRTSDERVSHTSYFHQGIAESIFSRRVPLTGLGPTLPEFLSVRSALEAEILSAAATKPRSDVALRPGSSIVLPHTFSPSAAHASVLGSRSLATVLGSAPGAGSTADDQLPQRSVDFEALVAGDQVLDDDVGAGDPNGSFLLAVRGVEPTPAGAFFLHSGVPPSLYSNLKENIFFNGLHDTFKRPDMTDLLSLEFFRVSPSGYEPALPRSPVQRRSPDTFWADHLWRMGLETAVWPDYFSESLPTFYETNEEGDPEYYTPGDYEGPEDRIIGLDVTFWDYWKNPSILDKYHALLHIAEEGPDPDWYFNPLEELKLISSTPGLGYDEFRRPAKALNSLIYGPYVQSLSLDRTGAVSSLPTVPVMGSVAPHGLEQFLLLRREYHQALESSPGRVLPWTQWRLLREFPGAGTLDSRIVSPMAYRFFGQSPLAAVTAFQDFRHLDNRGSALVAEITGPLLADGSNSFSRQSVATNLLYSDYNFGFVSPFSLGREAQRLALIPKVSRYVPYGRWAFNPIYPELRPFFHDTSHAGRPGARFYVGSVLRYEPTVLFTMAHGVPIAEQPGEVEGLMGGAAERWPEQLFGNAKGVTRLQEFMEARQAKLSKRDASFSAGVGAKGSSGARVVDYLLAGPGTVQVGPTRSTQSSKKIRSPIVIPDGQVMELPYYVRSPAARTSRVRSFGTQGQLALLNFLMPRSHQRLNSATLTPTRISGGDWFDNGLIESTLPRFVVWYLSLAGRLAAYLDWQASDIPFSPVSSFSFRNRSYTAAEFFNTDELSDAWLGARNREDYTVWSRHTSGWRDGGLARVSSYCYSHQPVARWSPEALRLRRSLWVGRTPDWLKNLGSESFFGLSSRHMYLEGFEELEATAHRPPAAEAFFGRDWSLRTDIWNPIPFIFLRWKDWLTHGAGPASGMVPAPLETNYGRYLSSLGHTLARSDGLDQVSASAFRFWAAGQRTVSGPATGVSPLYFLGNRTRPLPLPVAPDVPAEEDFSPKHVPYSSFWWAEGRVPAMDLPWPRDRRGLGFSSFELQSDLLVDSLRPQGSGFFRTPWSAFWPSSSLPSSAFFRGVLTSTPETLEAALQRDRRTHMLKLRLRRLQLPSGSDAYFTRWVEGSGHFARRPSTGIYLSQGRFGPLDRLRFSVLWDESLLQGAYGGHFFLSLRLLVENLGTIWWLLQHGSFSGKLINLVSFLATVVNFDLLAALSSAV